jgi:putative hemolysin
MNYKIMFMIFAVALMIYGCTQTVDTNDNSNTKIANPASKNCIDKGGQLDIRTAEEGSQRGYCILKDGTECEEWAYMRGECPSK